ncbi:hypothetical protein TSTA_114840 [Talaromyces stipitatus ATCC 10500]|uniref:Frequency clock protein n=1 Tax=Talaromyces stipitatus (strain ATCC 10500 / CBS 375.48 / QM 6759 / NRRL 1006) TaxID=441959 RepID=B8M9C0_TALSN|nr:uncharacterized protein TSTA_114840 [Talaromyces stipitatus ATCC 10500]EED17680.1 hypothetical protein TSTA_114840 [Talaromyces stipitatus ATCC 10500]
MTASLDGRKGNSNGSHSLPRSASKSRGTAGIVQMPHRSIGNRTEQSQQHAESEHWFIEANQHVTSQLDGLGDDAPFFLDAVEPNYSGGRLSSPDPIHDPVLSYMRGNNNERENEELRGIIDDLTLDIKRLKRKLRRYKERDPPRLQADKLFDVRTYGLPRRRKRQLERILQRFASDISASHRFPRDRSTATKSKHMSDNTPVSGDDALKAIVTMLFKQRLGVATKTNHHHFENTSQPPDAWFDVNDTLNSIKHVISNIDPDFAREALKEHGTPLELSSDGCSVRWTASSRRGLAWSNLMYDHVRSHPKAQDFRSKSIHPETVLGLAGSNTTSLHRPTFSDYIPFISRTRASEADDYYDDDGLSMISSGSEISFRASVSGENSSIRLRSQAEFQDRSTYYKNSTFYIDYSGDNLDVKDSQPQEFAGTEDVAGKRKRQSSPDRSRCQQRPHTTNIAANRFHSYPSEKDPALNLSQYNSPALSLAEEPLSSAVNGYMTTSMELPASGIGDVVPDDNFAVHVAMKYVPVKPNEETGGCIDRTSRCEEVPCRKNEASLVSHHTLKDTNTSSSSNGRIHKKGKKLFQTHVVTATHEELAPSSLPPAICGFFSSASSDDDGDREGEDGDDESDAGFGKRGEVMHHDIPPQVQANVRVTEGEPLASVHSIERWNAHVVASLGNRESSL